MNRAKSFQQQVSGSAFQTSSRWHWREMREKKAFLALDDGSIYRGYSVGARRDTVGEVVFNTGMTGYQEILSDPSYKGQFVVMTYPEIGNTGINSEDMESQKFFVNGFVIHELNSPSNWRATKSLTASLAESDVPCIAGIDTRSLTRKLRDEGTMKAFMSVTGETAEKPAVKKAAAWGGLDNQDYAQRVSCNEPYQWDKSGDMTCSWGIADELPEPDLKIAAYDFGIKSNILRSMRRNGMDVTVVPAKTTANKVLRMKPDGVFFSNGPGDPDPLTYAIDSARYLLGKVPIMGICLGHQILGLATGGKRYKLKFGHHGCNHPVKDIQTEKVEITSQNHNFAIECNLSEVEITHINLNDQTIEGLKHRKEPMFAVQYHPEACPGPHDPYYLFNRFRELILKA